MIGLSSIRVTYAGLISFGTGIVSIFTGLIFTLIVTRQLSQEEFGTWSLIGALTAYVMIFEPIVSYWSTREIARKKESGKTVYLSGGLFAAGAVPIYLLIVILFGTQGGVEQNFLFLAALLVPTRYFRHILASINLGYKPQTTAYSLLVFEITKIISALILIYYFEMGLEGAILTVVLASICAIIFSTIRTFDKIRGTFEIKFLKSWMKRFWLPTYPTISEIISSSDVVLFTIIVGSVEYIAYWGVAMAIAGIILHASNISKAVYGKLLETGKKEYLQENLTQVFYFIFPLSAISIIFAKPGLFSLNPIYEAAVPIVIFLAFVVFFRTLSGVFTFYITGFEKVDLNENASFVQYLKSKLFYIPTLRMIQRSGYFISLAIILILLKSQSSGFDLVVYWALVALFTEIPYFLYLYSIIRKEFSLKIQKKSVFTYLFVSIVTFGITYLLMEEFLVYETSIFQFLPNLLLFVVIGVSSYLGLTYVIDFRTRKLFKAVIAEIKK